MRFNSKDGGKENIDEQENWLYLIVKIHFPFNFLLVQGFLRNIACI
jgi:hypothetical protein